MIRLMTAIGVMLAFLAPTTARAQVELPPCSVPQLAEPASTFMEYSRERAVRGSEIVVEAVVESYGSAKANPNWPRPVVLRIDKVWKGDVTPRVILLIPMARFGPDMWDGTTGLECLHPVQIGARYLLGAPILGKNDHPNFTVPELAEDTVVSGPGSLFTPMYLPSHDVINFPLHDPTLDRALAAYQVKTEPLRQAAAKGGKDAKLAFAEYLLANNETHRAFTIYDALVRDNPNDLDLLLVIAVARNKARLDGEPEATLAEVRERAPHTEKWRSKIARARLAATGLLTAEGKDWSDLKRIHTKCYSDHENFDGTVFDRAELPECAFRYSSFRDASFRGTDLTGSYFQNSDLTGAKYDCATKLPDDLDPKAAGMINVEGQCSLH